MSEEVKNKAIRLLTEKQAELGRLPEKADFSGSEVAAIKSAFGPWPRALEAAGVKEVSPAHIARKQRVKAKRKAGRKNKQLKITDGQPPKIWEK